MYSPVTTGIPAIFAYPRATGMLTAATVTPASTSPVTSDRRTGSSPPITGTARSRARRERPPEPGTVTSVAAVAIPRRRRTELIDHRSQLASTRWYRRPSFLGFVHRGNEYDISSQLNAWMRCPRGADNQPGDGLGQRTNAARGTVPCGDPAVPQERRHLLAGLSA